MEIHAMFFFVNFAQTHAGSCAMATHAHGKRKARSVTLEDDEWAEYLARAADHGLDRNDYCRALVEADQALRLVPTIVGKRLVLRPSTAHELAAEDPTPVSDLSRVELSALEAELRRRHEPR